MQITKKKLIFLIIRILQLPEFFFKTLLNRSLIQQLEYKTARRLAPGYFPPSIFYKCSFKKVETVFSDKYSFFRKIYKFSKFEKKSVFCRKINLPEKKTFLGNDINLYEVDSKFDTFTDFEKKSCSSSKKTQLFNPKSIIFVCICKSYYSSCTLWKICKNLMIYFFKLSIIILPDTDIRISHIFNCQVNVKKEPR